MEQSVETLQRLSELSVELTEIAREIRTGRGTAGEILHNKEYAQNLNKTVLELKAFLEDIQKNPKKYVKFSIF
jgi:phospholipid/cholesterol/gamma-HCH transport system substrate-binding protein